MTGRTRRVYFEDEIRERETNVRRTRGQSHSRGRGRSASADRVHSIYDDNFADNLADMQGRERVVGRDAYDELLRDNQILRIELRGREDDQAYIVQLQRDNAELKRENRELRQSVNYNSDNDARKDGKLSSLRKKYAKLEVEVSDLKTKAAEWKTKATDWRKLYDDVNRRFAEMKRQTEDAQRRIEIVRTNITLIEAAKVRLEQENATLKRDLGLEERLRRRQNY
ncbi:hypothetical protein C8A00DRAFT_42763 [Chaetomidium leptoderma]|uniref:Uncharacterized protein n=1 Tax=Chaetomidium leptoderma TaxID=669021 RepID=A0AAN6VQC7_9PEZI|nr:hypothetical protein C8A00DRAFT_42763 [Chaetomidium leptoderma]